MRCPTREELAEYQQDALANRARETMHRHVEHCAACQREVQALARTVRLLETLPAPTMPEAIWAGVAQRLPATPHVAFRRRWWKVLAGAGVAAGIGIGLLVMPPPHSRLPEAPATTSAYIADHALLSTQDTLADRASAGVLLAAQRSAP